MYQPYIKLIYIILKASDRMCIAHIDKASNTSNIMLPLSAQSLCFCASSDGCNGGDVFTPWSHIQTLGLVTGGQVNGTGPFGSGYCSDFTLPHCHHHGPQVGDISSTFPQKILDL